MIVRNRAKELADLLSDSEKIRAERRKAKQSKSKYTGVGSDEAGFGGSGKKYGGFGSEDLSYGSYSGQVYGTTRPPFPFPKSARIKYPVPNSLTLSTYFSCASLRTIKLISRRRRRLLFNKLLRRQQRLPRPSHALKPIRRIRRIRRWRRPRKFGPHIHPAQTLHVHVQQERKRRRASEEKGSRSVQF
jgi:hypothetical protein